MFVSDTAYGVIIITVNKSLYFYTKNGFVLWGGGGCRIKGISTEPIVKVIALT